MPIITSAFLPPSPLLIPEIGKENTKILEQTIRSYQEIGESLKESEIETLIIISAHGPLKLDKISLNISPSLNLNFKEFGHLQTIKSFFPALKISSDIQKEIGQKREIRFVSEKDLNYGSAVPLYLFDSYLKSIKVLPIHVSSALNKMDHYQMGQRLAEVLKARPEKIALIATGTLSHKLKKNSPGGYSPKGARFDNRLIELLYDPEGMEKIINFDEKLANEALERSLNQLSLLLGIIGSNYQAKILSYQNDFGIGYLSASFDLQIAQI
jgi:aromatic ring-opening dioxygenase LigB subunit